MQGKSYNLISIVLLLAMLLIPTAFLKAQEDNKILAIKEQLIKKYETFNGRWPEVTQDGKWVYRNSVNWFSGFIGGELWNMYELTGDEKLKEMALKTADSLIAFAGIDNTHDMGFIFIPTCVKAYKHTGNVKYRNAALKAATMLAKRFNKSGNFLRAWGKLGTNDREGWTIIDTMMNLELLFWASEESGDPSFYEIAYKHAVTCMQEHVRSDYTSYHVVEHDPSTGKVIKRRTHQGYSDESTWARGQAWGIYGFSLAYNYTKDERFLLTSKKMADVFINKLPEDLVVYWDLDLSGAGVVRDASAAAIASSGMYLLSTLVNSRDEFLKYHDYAARIAKSLLNNYSFLNSNRQTEQGLLIHAVYNFNDKKGVDESYPCGDYYFTEAVNKYLTDLRYLQFNEKPHRETKCINDNWFYLEDDIKDFNRLYSTTKTWEKIDLPHSWNKFDAADNTPGYRRSISWYEKLIPLDKILPGKRYLLSFEAVNLKAEVYVNGKIAGGHTGGYLGFDLDITELLKPGVNEIFVKADNSVDPELIPSQKSDFFIYGGIPRDVYLKTIPEVHLSGLKISTPQVSEKSASLMIETSLNNQGDGKYVLRLTLLDDKGRIVLKEEKKTGKDNEKEEMLVSNIKKPHLWSVDDPYLYTVKAELIKDGAVLDELKDKTGFRWYEFKEHGAFYLNGKKVLLKGTHRHEDYAGLANALPDELHRKDMQMIKEMGANFVRLAHYPQDPEVYNECDRLGLLVWSENPWCRGGMGAEVWKKNTKNILKEMITEHYNHPSIILWSIGNESDWLPDFPGGDNKDSLKAFAQVLHNIAKELDPYRLTCTRKFPEAQNIVDVFSPSIWSGWYSDVYKNYEPTILKAIKNNTRLFHAEYGGDSHMGRHVEHPVDGDGKITSSGGDEPINKIKTSSIANSGDWSESYIVDLFDWYLSATEKINDFSGSAQWAFKDFPTPLRPENPIPFMNQKGLVDREGNPKDAYYVFKSYWTDKPNFCYIESHSWKERSGAIEEKREVNVFSNCENVELFINGISQGIKKKDKSKFPASGLSWMVNFREGKNIILAKAVEENKIISDSIDINYYYSLPGSPEDIVLEKSVLPNGKVLVTAKVIDKDGRVCDSYNKRVYFSKEGMGRLLENYGTYTKSLVREFSNGRASIEFKPVPFEKAVVEARNQDFKGTYITIEY